LAELRIEEVKNDPVLNGDATLEDRAVLMMLRSGIVSLRDVLVCLILGISVCAVIRSITK
jgi:hypothetical protein